MSYTLWSRGRLLGASNLGYARSSPRFRMGDSFPTPLGETLMPVAAGVSPAMIELTRVSQAIPQNLRLDSGALSPEGLAALRQSTEYADLAAAEAQSEALELRGPDGSVIPTESIGIQDTQFLLSLATAEEDDDWYAAAAGDFDPEREAELERAIEADRALLEEWWGEEDEEPDWDPSPAEEFPRYQILVQLCDDRSVPDVQRPAGA